jgi:hypothetical protein
MVLTLNEIEELCHRGPGLEAWVFQEGVGTAEPALVHLAHPGSAGRAVE